MKKNWRKAYGLRKIQYSIEVEMTNGDWRHFIGPYDLATHTLEWVMNHAEDLIGEDARKYRVVKTDRQILYEVKP